MKKLSGKWYNLQKIAIQYDNLQKKCDSLQFANMALCLICIILKEIQKSNTFRLCFTCEQGSHIGCRPGPMIKQNGLIIKAFVFVLVQPVRSQIVASGGEHNIL